MPWISRKTRPQPRARGAPADKVIIRARAASAPGKRVIHTRARKRDPSAILLFSLPSPAPSLAPSLARSLSSRTKSKCKCLRVPEPTYVGAHKRERGRNLADIRTRFFGALDAMTTAIGGSVEHKHIEGVRRGTAR